MKYKVRRPFIYRNGTYYEGGDIANNLCEDDAMTKSLVEHNFIVEMVDKKELIEKLRIFLNDHQYDCVDYLKDNIIRIAKKLNNEK